MQIRPRLRAKTAALTAAALCACSAMLLCGCSAKPQMADYVSEYRSHIYEGTQGEYSVFATFSRREYPYLADGCVGKMQDLFEIAVTVPDNTKTYAIRFGCGGKEYEAELAYNSVEMTHECSLSLPEPAESAIDFTVTVEEEEGVSVQAADMRGEGALELAPLLERVQAACPDTFSALTSGRSFAGEVYVRLLCEDERRFFYVGVTDREGKTASMIADAATGEVLATRDGT